MSTKPCDGGMTGCVRSATTVLPIALAAGCLGSMGWASSASADYSIVATFGNRSVSTGTGQTVFSPGLGVFDETVTRGSDSNGFSRGTRASHDSLLGEGLNPMLFGFANSSAGGIAPAATVFANEFGRTTLNADLVVTAPTRFRVSASTIASGGELIRSFANFSLSAGSSTGGADLINLGASNRENCDPVDASDNYFLGYVTLQPDVYELNAESQSGLIGTYANRPGFVGGRSRFSFNFVEVSPDDPPGGSPDLPILPSLTLVCPADEPTDLDDIENPNFPVDIELIFEDADGGLWYDPDATARFDYEMRSNGDVFTDVLEFPTIDGLSFRVESLGIDLGSFAGGESLDFSEESALQGLLEEDADGDLGVRAFSLFIDGLPDTTGPADPVPLKLDFGRDGVTFAILSTTAIPEPTTGTGLLLGLCFMAARRRRSA